MSTLGDYLRSIRTLVGGPVGGRLSEWSANIPRIAALEEPLIEQSDYDLKKTSLSLRYRARSGEPLERLLVEAFALVRVAGRRKINMRHFDVQLLGGMAVHFNSIVEMQTGEGKTLTATLPLYLAALSGKGAHLATVNDYLAQRDADWMRPIYETLGMKVGCIQSQMPQAERQKQYARDITYGTANEMGFDFLRDRLLKRRISEGQRDVRAMLARPATREPVRAICTSCSSTRRTAFSSTRPARRSSSARCRAKRRKGRPRRIAGRRRRRPISRTMRITTTTTKIRQSS
jgi:preprotein translocase subunit SecA